MKYAPQITPTPETRWAPGTRPPIDQLPASLAKLITERDELKARVAGASAHDAKLADPARDAAAKVQDDAAATAAARAGAALPARVATTALAEERADAATHRHALEAAFRQVSDELEHEAEWVIVPQIREQRDAKLAKARTKIEQAAHRLADSIETAVAADAVDAWILTGVHQPRAQVLDTEYLNARRPGQAAIPGLPAEVRDLLAHLALTCLEA